MQELLIDYLGRDPTSVIMGYLIPLPKLPFMEELRGHPMTYINKHEDSWYGWITRLFPSHPEVLRMKLAEMMIHKRRTKHHSSYRNGKKRAKRNSKRNRK